MREYAASVNLLFSNRSRLIKVPMSCQKILGVARLDQRLSPEASGCRAPGSDDQRRVGRPQSKTHGAWLANGAWSASPACALPPWQGLHRLQRSKTWHTTPWAIDTPSSELNDSLVGLETQITRTDQLSMSILGGDVQLQLAALVEPKP